MFRCCTFVHHKLLFIPPPPCIDPLQIFLLSSSAGAVGWGRETRANVAVTSEIKNPFTLLSHPFGGQPKTKQLLGWQSRRQTASETQCERKGEEKSEFRKKLESFERNRIKQSFLWAPAEEWARFKRSCPIKTFSALRIAVGLYNQ